MIRRALTRAILIAIAASRVCAQTPDDFQEYTELVSQLEAQQLEIRRLQQQMTHHPEFASNSAFNSVGGQSCSCPAHSIRRLPVIVEQPVSTGKSAGGSDYTLRYYCEYDNGFVIRPTNRETHPFELKTNAWIQFRHVGFARDVESWTDNAGVTRPVNNRNKFDVERARLVFSGFALTPDLTYFLQLDGDTDGREGVDFFDYWWGYQLCDCLQIQFGKRKVPGSRQWLLGARQTRFIDRPMANDFFRPDRSVGLFAMGAIGVNGHYEMMVGNGVRTANLDAAGINDKLSYAATVYWDPWGDFGGQLVDYDCSQSPLARFGASFTYGAQGDLTGGLPLAESSFAQLTDGTRLTALSALAGGATVSEFDAYLVSIDAAMKWQGWSVNGETFFRWLQSIDGDGPLPLSDLYQRGFYVEGGKFLIPGRLDVNARYSQIDGFFGNASEAAAGINLYPADTHKMKVSFDVADIQQSPLNNTASDILVGDDGTLFRTQFQVEF